MHPGTGTARRVPRVDPGVGGQLAGQVHDRRPDPCPHDGLGGRPVRQPHPEFIDVRRRSGGRHEDRHGRPIARGQASAQISFEVASDPRPVVVGKPVGLVDDHGLTVQPRDPRSKESVVQNGVVIFLEVGHPCDGVNLREHGLDPFPVRCLDRIHVREVQDGDRTQAVSLVLADIVDAEPGKQWREPIAISRRDPRDRLAGRRPPHRRCAHRRTGQGVQQARFPDARPAHQSQDIRVRRETEPL